MPEIKEVSSARCFGGYQKVYSHRSETLGCTMRFGVYLPPQEGPRPVLYWLSGLTCTEDNFISKAGAQRYAADHGLILVAPDTSPRGVPVPGQDESWDLGTGAGFYVDAVVEPWYPSYRMYTYVAKELPDLVEQELPIATDRRSISGHSMGGHGALVVALKNPGRYRSVSAFAPICAPADVPWGEKAFGAYLGPDREKWLEWDASRLVPSAQERLPILVDQGDADMFLDIQLQPHKLEAACRAAGHPLTLRRRPDYDHGYYFVSTFIGEHIAHHAAALSG